MIKKITIKTDEVGRIVIPKEIRKSYELTKNDNLYIRENERSITLEKIDYSVVIDSFGRVLIPQKIRKKYSFLNNDKLFLSTTENGIEIESYIEKHQELIQKLKYIEKNYNIETILFNDKYIYSCEKYKKLNNLSVPEINKWLISKQLKYKQKKYNNNLTLFIIYTTEKEKLIQLIYTLV